MMQGEAGVDVMEAQGPEPRDSGSADHLRFAGGFAELAARSSAKRRWAAEAGIEGRCPPGVAVTDLIDWFVADRLGEELNASARPRELAVPLGFRDLGSFIAAFWLRTGRCAPPHRPPARTDN